MIGLVVSLVVVLVLAVVAGGRSGRRRLASGEDGGGHERAVGRRSWRQWYEISRAVSRGRAVRDPALAAAAVIRAEYVISRLRAFTGRRTDIVFLVLAVVQLAGGVRMLLEPGSSSPGWRVVGVGSAVLLAGCFAGLPLRQRRARRNADRAGRLNQALRDRI